MFIIVPTASDWRRGHSGEPGGDGAPCELADACNRKDRERRQDVGGGETEQVDALAGDDEEHRQQELHADALQPLGDRMEQVRCVAAGYGDTEQERTDQLVHTDPARDVRAQQQPGEKDRELLRTELVAASTVRAQHPPLEQRSHEREEHDREGDQLDNDEDHIGRVAPTGQRHRQREQGERDDVVDGGTGDEQQTERYSEHVSFTEDSGEHRERGAAHRHADEHCERGEIRLSGLDLLRNGGLGFRRTRLRIGGLDLLDLRLATGDLAADSGSRRRALRRDFVARLELDRYTLVILIQVAAEQAEPEQERKRDGGQRDHDSSLSGGANDVEVHLHPDDEHEQHEAERGHQFEEW